MTDGRLKKAKKALLDAWKAGDKAQAILREAEKKAFKAEEALSKVWDKIDRAQQNVMDIETDTAIARRKET